MAPRQQRLFISYSHEDEAQKRELIKTIKSLSPRIDHQWHVWDDRKLKPGDDFDQEIIDRIASADIFFALVSRDYLSSEYCRKEMYEALRHAETKGCRVVPVIVRDTPTWRKFRLGHNNAIPKDAKAPTDFRHEDVYWAEVQKGLEALLLALDEDAGPDGLSDTNDEAGTGSEPSSDIEAVGFECQSEEEFHRQVRAQVEDALGQRVLQQAIRLLLGAQGTASHAIELATEKLVSQEPIKAIDHWTSVVRDCLSSTTADRHRDGGVFWRASEHVHLALLPRVVSRDWISDWIHADRSKRSPLEFRVRFRDKPPNRSIEVLLCRLDAQRRISFLTTDPSSPAESAVPASVMHANDDPLRYLAAPEPIAAAETLAKRLFALDGQTPPERMTGDDWDELDSILVRGRAGAKSYYIVIPAENEVFGNPAVLEELKGRLPNLPRIIVGDKSGGQPFNCRPSDVEHAILTFYRLEPTKE